MFPVAESETVVAWTTTQIENDPEDDKSGNRDNLDRSKDELRFAICSYIDVNT